MNDGRVAMRRFRFRPMASASGARRLEVQALGLAMVLAAIVYGSYLSRAGFPLNDGGLFYAMIRDIQRAHYALPRVTSYDPRIPFAYPPLGLYIAAIVSGLTHASVLGVMWLLPAAVTLATIPAFLLLARRLLDSEYAVSAAVVAYALLPGTFLWRIMGGGITRSVGMLFALLAISCLHRACEERLLRPALAGGFFAGLTALTHLEAAIFVALSAVLMLAWYGRTARALAGIVLADAVALAVSSPWWLTVLHRDGFAPFVASLHTRGDPVLSVLFNIVAWRAGREPLFPFLGALGLLGFTGLALQRRWFLPVWFAAEVVVDSRGGSYFAVVPLCLAAGVAVAGVLLPAFAAARSNAQQETGQGLPDRHAITSTRRWPAVAVALVGVAVAYAMLNGLAVQGPLSALTAQDRAAMHWVSGHTTQSSTFVIIPVGVSGGSPEGLFWTDRLSEWFPALAERRSVATVQGQEWVGDFEQTITDYSVLQRCVDRDAACLESWAAKTGRSFDYIYVPNAVGPDGRQCCWALRQSLGANPNYSQVYDGPGASIFRLKRRT